MKRYTRQKKVNNQSHIVLMFRKKCGGMTWVRKALSERVTFELKKFLTDNLRDRLRDRGLKWLAHSSLDTPRTLKQLSLNISAYVPHEFLKFIKTPV